MLDDNLRHIVPSKLPKYLWQLLLIVLPALYLGNKIIEGIGGVLSILIAIVGCLILYFYPAIGLAAYMGINFGACVSFTTLIRLLFLSTILGAGFYTIKCLKNKNIRFHIDTFLAFQLLFFLYIVVNWCLNDGLDNTYSRNLLKHLFMWWVVPFAIIILFKNDLKILKQFIYGYFLVIIIYIIVVFLSSPQDILNYFNQLSYRFSVYNLDPINFSHPFIAGFLASLFVYFNSRNGLLKVAALVGLCACLFLVLVSGTRQAVASVFVGGSLFIFLIRGKRIHIFPATFCAILIFFILYYSYHFQYTFLIKRYINTLQSPIEAMLSRYYYWEHALYVFMENPIKGVGLGQYGLRAGLCSEAHVHNLLLNVLAEQGLIGFFLFIGLSGYTVKSAFRILRIYHYTSLNYQLCVFFISVFVSFFFKAMMSGGLGSNSMLWLSVGAIWCISDNRRRNKEWRTLR